MSRMMLTEIVTIAAVLFIGHCKAACEDGWCKYPSGNMAFQFNETPKTWDEAQAACKASDGFLAEPSTSEIDSFLREKLSPKKINNWWLGATDRRKEGTFLWQQCRSEMKYTNWHSGEPNDWRNQEDCLEYWLKNQWADDSCGNKRSYICQKYTA